MRFMISIVEQVVSWGLVIFGTFTPIYFLFKVLGFSGFQGLTSYIPGNTPLHRLSPMTKLVILVGITLTASSSICWVGALEGLALLPLFYPLKLVRKVAGFSFTQVVGMAWGFAVFTSPSVLSLIFHSYNVVWVFPSYFQYLGYVPELSVQALEYGFQTAMRVWAMLLASSLLLVTTTPTDVMRTLERLGLPESLTLSIMVGMAFVPRVFSTMDESYRLQQLRGEGILNGVKTVYRSVIPVAIFLFRRARITGLSLETRAFGKRRRRLGEVKISRFDLEVMIAVFSFTMIDLVLVAIGVIPAIPFR